MSDEQRRQVFEVLMRGIPPESDAYPILAEIAAEDVNALELVIDQILLDRAMPAAVLA